MTDLVNAILCLALLMALGYGYRWLAKETAQILSKWWW
jgi:hypothetical protein